MKKYNKQSIFLFILAYVFTPHLVFANPIPFGAQIWYQYREKITDAKPGEKNVTSVSREIENLHPCVFEKDPKTTTAEPIQSAIYDKGTRLPFSFEIKLQKKPSSTMYQCWVNIIDQKGRSLTGFPQVLKQDLDLQNNTRADIEIPLSSTMKKILRNRLKGIIGKNGWLGAVNLVIGTDEDFTHGKTCNN